mmetsp:Transcript_9648/g.23329  ORF Transcript_9648/g.23329 Transcript_9648/m.23329 type:complete len:108 (-) Transcript_9648:118-441(-)
MRSPYSASDPRRASREARGGDAPSTAWFLARAQRVCVCRNACDASTTTSTYAMARINIDMLHDLLVLRACTCPPSSFVQRTPRYSGGTREYMHSAVVTVIFVCIFTS